MYSSVLLGQSQIDMVVEWSARSKVKDLSGGEGTDEINQEITIMTLVDWGGR